MPLTPEEIQGIREEAEKWALSNADETMATNSALNRGYAAALITERERSKLLLKEIEVVITWMKVNRPNFSGLGGPISMLQNIIDKRNPQNQQQ